MSDKPVTKPTPENKYQYLTDIVVAKKDINNSFVIEIDNITIPLSWLLGLVTNNRGEFKSMGMTFNPTAGINTVELAVYYIVLKSSKFNDQLSDIVNRAKDAKK